MASTNLTRAYLSGANLRDVDLTWANLIEADLSSAYMLRANLTGAKLSGSEWHVTIGTTIIGGFGPRANAVKVWIFGQASKGVAGPGWRMIWSAGRLTR
ncbi:pentapeptide repeat-containing protein [Acrocarpospora catenulata]|uniref:pentapeptide repeat-containing protein n=1 Tax=Acrocarpospora catenulata TaxID=2836182 RepID=UPI0035578C5A